jgi:cytoskeletal protein CcmA (bactofilin family)
MSKTPSTITLLDRGCEFNGKLSFEGIVRIDGSFQGEIFSQDHLIVGEGASVEGNVQIGHIEVSGTFKGSILAQEKITIHPTGRVQGTIQTRQIEVRPGGLIDGQVEMSALREAADLRDADGLTLTPLRSSLQA